MSSFCDRFDTIVWRVKSLIYIELIDMCRGMTKGTLSRKNEL